MGCTESLFTACAAWSLYAVLTGRWLTAATLAALAGLTRPTGIAVAAAVTVTALLAVPEDTEARAAALACISEARRHMGVEPSRSQPADIAHAQRLARSIDALCRQYEALNCGQMTGDHWSPAQLAFRRWAIHATKCRICRTDDSHCDRSRRLGDHWNQLRRNPPTTGAPVGGRPSNGRGPLG
ncbi:DUF6415 family natural product biosynthesis protein [Streptomyces sp. TRM70350]|uniref:DUF6415 family natural product biosynthesis protein n=1 Tax=Streptomyces sp. TRM70350 TaxID=2856165 RepID=UPI001C461992|nr:hypothetical protein [Streptomyces sp. TRM70350]